MESAVPLRAKPDVGTICCVQKVLVLQPATFIPATSPAKGQPLSSPIQVKMLLEGAVPDGQAEGVVPDGQVEGVFFHQK